MKEFKVTTPFGAETCTMSTATCGGHIHIQLWCEDGPFATLTRNLAPRGTARNVTAVDTNNCPWAESLIKRLKIGTPTGNYVRSGFCMYPLYAFDTDRIAAYTGKEWK